MKSRNFVHVPIIGTTQEVLINNEKLLISLCSCGLKHPLTKIQTGWQTEEDAGFLCIPDLGYCELCKVIKDVLVINEKSIINNFTCTYCDILRCLH